MSSIAVCFPGLLWIVRNTLVTKECDPGRPPWKSYLGYLAISRMIPRKGTLPGRPAWKSNLEFYGYLTIPGMIPRAPYLVDPLGKLYGILKILCHSRKKSALPQLPLPTWGKALSLNGISVCGFFFYTLTNSFENGSSVLL